MTIENNNIMKLNISPKKAKRKEHLQEVILLEFLRSDLRICKLKILETLTTKLLIRAVGKEHFKDLEGDFQWKAGKNGKADRAIMETSRLKHYLEIKIELMDAVKEYGDKLYKAMKERLKPSAGFEIAHLLWDGLALLKAVSYTHLTLPTTPYV